MMLRPVCDKRVSENRESLESQDMDYVLKLNEYLDILDFMEEVQAKDQEKTQSPKGY